jgi:hypothetical protein
MLLNFKRKIGYSHGVVLSYENQETRNGRETRTEQETGLGDLGK